MGLVSRAPVGRCHARAVARQLLDPELRRLQTLDAQAEQLLAASEEGDRVVDRNVAALEPRDDVVELALELLERPLLAQLRTSSTRAPTAPVASSISRRSPGAVADASRSATPRARANA